MSELRQVIAEWLESHKDEITHLRPRRWCGQWALLAYDRRKSMPYIDGQPMMMANEATLRLVDSILGPGMVEDPLEAGRGGPTR